MRCCLIFSLVSHKEKIKTTLENSFVFSYILVFLCIAFAFFLTSLIFVVHFSPIFLFIPLTKENWKPIVTMCFHISLVAKWLVLMLFLVAQLWPIVRPKKKTLPNWAFTINLGLRLWTHNFFGLQLSWNLVSFSVCILCISEIEYWLVFTRVSLK